MIKGDVSRSFRILEVFRIEGVEPLFICNMLSRELKILESIKFDASHGKNLSQVVGSEFTSRKTSKYGGLQNENFAAERYFGAKQIK